MYTFIFILLIVIAAYDIITLVTPEELSPIEAAIKVILIISTIVAMLIILGMEEKYLSLEEKVGRDLQMKVDSIKYADSIFIEFNNQRFQNVSQESWLTWELLHAIYKQDSIRWYKDIRILPEYKELDRFRLGNWEDFYLY